MDPTTLQLLNTPIERTNLDDEIFSILAENENLNAGLASVAAAAAQCFGSRRNCIRDYVEEVIPTYTEKEFITHFRIQRSLYESLSERFELSSEFPKFRSVRKCSARKCTAMFLWFAFAGHEACSFRDVADRFDLSISSVSRIIERYSMFLSSLGPSIIKWPNEEEMLDSGSIFGNKAGFSKAIGCIDGTHVVIDPPALRKDDYIDRKGTTSLCVQAICNENKKIINLFVGFPGSSHDSWVFRNSAAFDKLSALGEFYVLGDSAYPCDDHLVTPYRDNGHLTRQQKMFNIKLSSCRVAIEHTFGILKQRFRQLYYFKLRGIPKICHFIRACCVLHNIAGEEDLTFILETNEVESESVSVRLGDISRGNAAAVRDRIRQEMLNR